MRNLAIFGVLVALSTTAMPAMARRTAIDNDIKFDLSGYCDLNGDECGPTDGKALGYSVKFGNGPTYERVFANGNGYLSFGSAIDFTAVPAFPGMVNFRTLIIGGQSPFFGNYGRDLIGFSEENQNFKGGDKGESAFVQSAKLGRVDKGDSQQRPILIQG
ncbi:MAG: hypothetical protein ACOYLS_07340, partial [Polymorphobacter sp.]